MKIKVDLRYLSLAWASVGFKLSNLKIHRKNYSITFKNMFNKICTYTINASLPLSKSTILNCENGIFEKSLSVCHETIFLENCLILVLSIYCALSWKHLKKILRSHHENLAQTTIFPKWNFFW